MLYLCIRNAKGCLYCFLKLCYRDVAQLVAHYVRDVGVASSSPVIPTRSPLRIVP